MTEEQMNAYKMRIAQAGVGDLTVIMLEMEIQWITEALDAYEKQKIEDFISCVEKAQGTQVELMNVLNMENPLAVVVYSVFIFINKHLIEAKIRQDPLDLERCRGMLEKYHKSFLEVAKTDASGPVMEQSEKVYAGLTYGADGLVENSVGGMEFKI